MIETSQLQLIYSPIFTCDCEIIDFTNHSVGLENWQLDG